MWEIVGRGAGKGVGVCVGDRGEGDGKGVGVCVGDSGERGGARDGGRCTRVNLKIVVATKKHLHLLALRSCQLFKVPSELRCNGPCAETSSSTLQTT